MALFPEELIAEIRQRVDIVRLVGEHLTLRRAGTSFVGLCPFHEERSGSFYVHPDRRFFHCFGCGKSGDVFTFVQEVEGKSFPESVKQLAELASVSLPNGAADRRVSWRQGGEEREQILRVNELCARWFCACLAAPEGQRARAYIAGRGLSSATQQMFGIGFAPPGWEALVRYLESQGIAHELAERAGLIHRRKGAHAKPKSPPTRATHYDFLVDRVVYPLTSLTGEVLGFGGRLLGETNSDQPKYKNSPETPVYRKGSELFGLHLAKNAMRKQGQALVVEGNFDVMALHDRGFACTVAPQGTALTREQVRLLRRFVREVVIMFDGDAAGQAAMYKSLPLLLEAELKVKVITLRSADGSKLDPDNLVRDNPKRMAELMAMAPDGVEHCLELGAARYGITVSGKVQAVEYALPLLRAVADPLARDLYLAGFSKLLAMDVALLRRALKSGVAPETVTPVATLGGRAETATSAVRTIAPVYAKLFALLGRYPELFSLLPTEVIAHMTDNDVAALLLVARKTGQFVAGELITEADAAIRGSVATALFSEQFSGLEESPRRKALADIVQNLQFPDTIEELEVERQKALASSDFDRVRSVTARILWLRKTGRKGQQKATAAASQKPLDNSAGTGYETTRSNAIVEERN